MKTKNQKISESMSLTRHKRNNQICFVREFKIKYSACNKSQKEYLKRIMLEAKWFFNYFLAWTKSNPEKAISEFNSKINTITKKDKAGNDIAVELKVLPAATKQSIITEYISNLKTLETLKKRNKQKPGKIQFKSEVNSVNFKQYGVTHSIRGDKKIKLSGCLKPFTVFGLEQVLNDNLDFANAKLIHKANGFYIQLTCFIDKNEYKNRHQKRFPNNHKILGIDLGCSTTLITSEGKKFNCYIEESATLKKLQKQLNRKQKGSNNRRKHIKRICVEYQKLTNKKNDAANQLVVQFKNYDKIIFQDEQLNSWAKTGHGKVIQHSILGRVKMLLKNMSNSIMLKRDIPTTKFCMNCGKLHNEITVKDRIFDCSCGIVADRDVHAADNMVKIYMAVISNQPDTVERRSLTREEFIAAVEKLFKCTYKQLLGLNDSDRIILDDENFVPSAYFAEEMKRSLGMHNVNSII